MWCYWIPPPKMGNLIWPLKHTGSHNTSSGSVAATTLAELAGRTVLVKVLDFSDHVSETTWFLCLRVIHIYRAKCICRYIFAYIGNYLAYWYVSKYVYIYIYYIYTHVVVHIHIMLHIRHVVSLLKSLDWEMIGSNHGCVISNQSNGHEILGGSWQDSEFLACL